MNTSAISTHLHLGVKIEEMTNLRLPINEKSLILGKMPRQEAFSYTSHLVNSHNIESESPYNPSDEEVLLTIQKQRAKNYIELVFLKLIQDSEFAKGIGPAYDAILENQPRTTLPHLGNSAVKLGSDYYNLIRGIFNRKI